MKSTNSVQTNSRQSLQQMLYIKNIILSNIQDNAGEILPEEENELIKLDVNLPVKVDAWAWLLTNNGGMDKDIELLTDRKKAIEEAIQRIKNAKERLKTRANEILRMNKVESIEGNYFWIKRAINKSSRVILSKVEDEYKTFELPKLSFNDYTDLVTALEANTSDEDVPRLLTRIKEEKVESCGVKSLPNGHSAIETKEEPTIRIYKH